MHPWPNNKNKKTKKQKHKKTKKQTKKNAKKKPRKYPKNPEKPQKNKPQKNKHTMISRSHHVGGVLPTTVPSQYFYMYVHLPVSSYMRSCLNAPGVCLPSYIRRSNFIPSDVGRNATCSIGEAIAFIHDHSSSSVFSQTKTYVSSRSAREHLFSICGRAASSRSVRAPRTHSEVVEFEFDHCPEDEVGDAWQPRLFVPTWWLLISRLGTFGISCWSWFEFFVQRHEYYSTHAYHIHQPHARALFSNQHQSNDPYTTTATTTATTLLQLGAATLSPHGVGEFEPDGSVAFDSHGVVDPWRFSFVHLTIWWNFLAWLSLFIVLLDYWYRRMFWWKSPFLRDTSALLLVIQHPFAWIVCVGYWVGSLTGLAHETYTLASLWMHLPGTNCSGSADVCHSSVRLDILFHLVMPFLMMRQTTICSLRANKTTNFAVLLIYVVYICCYLASTLMFHESPYEELNFLKNPRGAIIQSLFITVFLIVRIVFDRYNILNAL
jgi:hypothetical protein